MGDGEDDGGFQALQKNNPMYSSCGQALADLGTCKTAVFGGARATFRKIFGHQPHAPIFSEVP